MSSLLNNRSTMAVITAAVIACFGATVFAQEDAEQPPDGNEEVEAIEEVVVTTWRSGDPAELEARNEALLRARIQKDMEQLRLLEEEYQWRKEGAATEEKSSRIKWGYDPRDEVEMRRDLPDPDWDKTKPATVFKVEF